MKSLPNNHIEVKGNPTPQLSLVIGSVYYYTSIKIISTTTSHPYSMSKLEIQDEVQF